MAYAIAGTLSALVGLMLIVFRRSLAASQVRQHGDWFGAPTDERALRRMRLIIVAAGCYMLAMSLLLAATWKGVWPAR